VCSRRYSVSITTRYQDGKLQFFDNKIVTNNERIISNADVTFLLDGPNISRIRLRIYNIIYELTN